MSREYNKFVEAVENDNIASTENNQKTYKTSQSKVLDLFTKIASTSKNSPLDSIKQMFIAAFAESAELTVRILLWLRDVRGGAGRRQVFRDLLPVLEELSILYSVKVAERIPEIGRFDDLFYFRNEHVRYAALEIFSQHLKSGNKLAAKWSPREKSANKKFAKELMQHLGMSSKDYRKYIASMTEVVETQMCSNQWEAIEYQKVPSCAMNQYAGAFRIHDEDRYLDYLNAVEDGTAKINASVLYPHDVLFVFDKYRRRSHIDETEVKLKTQQWKALPDYISNDIKIFPICDISGSMTGLPMLIAISLSLYIAEHNKSVFKDVVMTFSEDAVIKKFGNSEDIAERYIDLKHADFNFNTDVENCIRKYLKFAYDNNVPDADMPDMLLFITDMQFDQFITIDGKIDTFLENMIADFNRSHDTNYSVPKAVFWNVDARNNLGQSATLKDSKNVCEVSGFSPSIMQSVLSADYESFTPYNVMLKTIMNERYSLLHVPRSCISLLN